MSYLVKTTIDELSALTDELEIGDKIVFSTEDPDELRNYNLEPCQYNIIYKSKLLYESDYIIAVGLLFGRCTIAKDINIIAEGNINDEDARVDGIKIFLEEYYEKYCIKNKNGDVYLIVGS